MLAIRFAEFGSTGKFEMSWFHGLSGGKSCLPCRLAPGPRSGERPALDIVRGLVTGVGVGTGVVSVRLTACENGVQGTVGITTTAITATAARQNLIIDTATLSLPQFTCQ